MRSDGEPQDDAIEAWVRRHQVRAWRYVRLRGCPADIAEDLLQEVLLAAVHKGIHDEPDARAAAWLRGALDNLWRMHLRSEGRYVRRVEAAAAELALQQGAPDDDGEAWLEALRTCLTGLDGRAARLVELHYRRGASREEIAAAMEMRPNGVKAFLRRVRDGLRNCVRRRLADDREDR